MNRHPIASVAYNLRFPGQIFDGEAGMHQNGYRDYDPAVAGYIESDPIGLDGGVNTFAYVEGGPIFNDDPLGLRIFNPPRAVISEDVLEAPRKFNQKIGCDKDIYITGGNRKPTSKLGAGSKSKHVLGLAADVYVSGQSHLETANQALASGLFGGIGWYEEGYSGANGEGPHVHVDVRTNGPARWGFGKTGTEFHGSFSGYSPAKPLSSSTCGCE